MGIYGKLGSGLIILVLGTSWLQAQTDSQDILLDESFQVQQQDQVVGAQSDTGSKALDVFVESNQNPNLPFYLPEPQVFTDYRFTDTHSEKGGGTSLLNGADVGVFWGSALHKNVDDSRKRFRRFEVQDLFSFSDAKTDQVYGTTIGNTFAETIKGTYFLKADNGPLRWSVSQAFEYSSGNIDRPVAHGDSFSGTDSYDITPSSTLSYVKYGADKLTTTGTTWSLTQSYDFNIQSTWERGESTSGTSTTEIRYGRQFSHLFDVYGKDQLLATVNNDPLPGSVATYPIWTKMAVGVNYKPTHWAQTSLECSYEDLNPAYEKLGITLTVMYNF